MVATFTLYLAICSIIFMSAKSGNVHFENCGETTVHWVNINGCESSDNGIVVKRGNHIELSTSFLCDQSSEKVKISLKFITAKRTINIPYPNTNWCLKLAPDSEPCPLIAGKNYTFIDSASLPRIIPAFEGTLWGELYGDNGQMACVKVPNIKIK